MCCYPASFKAATVHSNGQKTGGEVWYTSTVVPSLYSSKQIRSNYEAPNKIVFDSTLTCVTLRLTSEDAGLVGFIVANG